MPGILVALMFRYVFAFRIFGEVWLLTGGGPARQTEVLATLIIAAGYLRTMYKRMLSGDA
jgi:ABC-type sugar transport system permease subunit